MARPKAFDETEALSAAMGCFWERGYEATSVRDLTEAMGIASPSLYNAFGDKRKLFRLALEEYIRRLAVDRQARLNSGIDPAGRISKFFSDLVDKSVNDPHRRGCLLINTAIEVAPHDEELAGLIKKHWSEVRAFLTLSLRQAIEADQLRLPVTCEKAADHLLAVLMGLRVLARTRPERDLLEGIVEATLVPIGIGPRRQ